MDCEQGSGWTYAEFAAEVDHAALALVAADLMVGERVGIWAPNMAQWTVDAICDGEARPHSSISIPPIGRMNCSSSSNSHIVALFAVEQFKTSNMRR